MTFLLGILATIISIPTIVGPFVMIMLFGYIYACLDHYPRTKNDKQIRQLGEQAEKLKAKLEETVKKNPKDASKYNEVIHNCDKTIKATQEYFKEIEDKKFMSEVSIAIGKYNDLIHWLDKPYTTDDMQIFLLAKILGINESVMVSKIIKNSDNLMESLSEFYGDLDKLYKPEEKEHLLKLIPELRNGGKCTVIKASGETDTVIVYSKSTNSIVTGSFEDLKTFKKSSLYKAADDSMQNIYYNMSKEALIEADKQLGYYRLSKCPDAVIPKELNLK